MTREKKPIGSRTSTDAYVMGLVDRVMRSGPDELKSRSYSARQQLLVDLANLQGESGIEWFWKRWGRRLLLPENSDELIETRDELRRIWQLNNAVRLNDTTGRVDREELHGPAPAFRAREILNKWLSWRPSAEQERAYETAQSAAMKESISEDSLRRIISDGRADDDYRFEQWMLPRGYVPFSCWIPARRLVPDTRSLRPMLIQGVFEHWGHFKYCANPDCVSPHFIAKRKDQTVCDAEVCKAEKQREHARKWWNENRATKTQKKTKAGAKAKKEGSGKNVAHKAR